jgi:hypothetical protein
MRNYLVLLSLLWAISACSNKEIRVEGKIEDMPPQQFWLEEMGAKSFIGLDSALTDKDGSFTATTPATTEPKMLRVRFAQGKYVMLVSSNETIKVKAKWDNMDDYSITGSAGSNTLKTFLGALRSHIRDVNSLDYVTKSINDKSQNKDSLLQQVQSDLRGMNTNFATYVKQFADTTSLVPNAVFAANILNPSVELNYLKIFYEKLPTKFKNSTLALEFKSIFDEKLGKVVIPE